MQRHRLGAGTLTSRIVARRFGIVALVLVLSLLIAPASAFASGRRTLVYTALGDSIAVGTGGTDSIGYVDLLAKRLARGHTHVTLNELSANGMTSEGLLSLVQDPGSYAALVGADAITVSIGGNDILQPVLGFVATQDPYVWNAMTAEQKLAVLSGLSAPLQAEVEGFAVNWAATIGFVRFVNPTAKIYVNTLYNPFTPGDGLYEGCDPLIQGINAAIVGVAPSGGYTVVDAYAEFAAHRSADEPLVHALTDPLPDPLHPTDRGYRLMFKLYKGAMHLK
jgi:lysophospholipase L1-like esterase